MSIKITFTDTSTDKVLSEEVLTDEEVKALNTEIELADFKCPICGKTHTGIGAWILNSIKNKSRILIDSIVEKSGRGSRYTPVATKLQIIKDLAAENSTLLKTASEKQAELEAQIK